MHRRFLLALAASASLVALGAPALAAETEAANTTANTAAIGELVVTADKRDEEVRNVPMSITALPGEQLQKLNDTDFADYAAMVPGLAVTPTEPGASRLTLRGLNAGGVASTVSVYVDETPFGSSSGLVDGSVLAGDFDTFDVQRIEVLRGPQGTLYGANSEGGLIKFVTNAPDPKAFAAAFEVGGDHVIGGSTDGTIDGMVNIPFANKAALRVSGFYDELPGWVNDPTLGETDVNKGRKYGGRASLLFDVTDNLSIRLTASDQEIRNDNSPDVDVDPVTHQPPSGVLTQSRLINEPSSFSYRNYNATVNWNFGWASLLSSTSYGQSLMSSVSDATTDLSAAIPPAVLSLILPAVFPTPPLGYLEDQQTNDNKFTQELRLTSSASKNLEWQVGGFYTRETGLINQVISTFYTHAGVPFGPALETANVSSVYQEYAAFASATYHFNSAFDIQLGGRYSQNNQTGTEVIGGLLASVPLFTVPSSQGVFNYSVAPEWHLNDSTMLYARVSNGYRPGGPNVIPASSPAGAPRSYQSDTTTNYEVGAKTSLFDNHLSLDVTAFLIEWKDVQLFEVIDMTGVNANGGGARSEGVEWDATVIPFQGLTVSLSGAYTDAVLTSPAPGVGGLPGDRLPYTPPLSLTLDGEYDWPVSSDVTAFLGAEMAYVGGRTTDFGPGRTEIASYDTLALRAGVEYRRWRLEIYAKNVTNDHGIANLGGPGLVPDGNLGAVFIQPATVGTTLSARF